MDKFEIDIYLCVISNSPSKILIQKDGEAISLPKKTLSRSDEAVNKIAAQLLFDMTNITEGWAAILSFGVPPNIIIGDSVPLLYACYIPEPTRISKTLAGKDICWMKYDDIKDACSALTIELIHNAVYRKI